MGCGASKAASVHPIHSEDKAEASGKPVAWPSKDEGASSARPPSSRTNSARAPSTLTASERPATPPACAAGGSTPRPSVSRTPSTQSAKAAVEEEAPDEVVIDPDPLATVTKAISLRGLRRLRESIREFFGPERYPSVTTTEVTMEWVKSVTAGHKCRVTEMRSLVDRQDVGSPAYFISHAWGNGFELLVSSVEAFLVAAGEGTRVWIDIFAVNQHPDGGPFQAADVGAFKDVVRAASAGTLVVMGDVAKSNPATRAWCVYEWAATLGAHGPDGLHMHMAAADRSTVVGGLDVRQAQCFKAEDKDYILGDVVAQHGSTEAFNAKLRLQLLLEPLSYTADLRRLMQGGGGGGGSHGGSAPNAPHTDAAAAAAAETAATSAAAAAADVAAAAAPPEWRWDELESWLAAGPQAGSRAVCVAGGAGEGKSTVSAAMLAAGSGGVAAAAAAAAGGSGGGAGASGGEERLSGGRGPLYLGAPVAMVMGAKEKQEGGSGGESTERDVVEAVIKGEESVGGGVGVAGGVIGGADGDGGGNNDKDRGSEEQGHGLWAVAYHFCKSGDARRQDPIRVLKSLAFQLAMRIPAIRKYYLQKLDPASVVGLTDQESAFVMLLLKPLKALAKKTPPSRQVVLLLDGLDEADPADSPPPSSSSPSSTSLDTSCPPPSSAAPVSSRDRPHPNAAVPPVPTVRGNQILALLSSQLARLPRMVRFVVTTRPGGASGQVLPCLRRALGGAAQGATYAAAQQIKPKEKKSVPEMTAEELEQEDMAWGLVTEGEGRNEAAPDAEDQGPNGQKDEGEEAKLLELTPAHFRAKRPASAGKSSDLADGGGGGGSGNLTARAVAAMCARLGLLAPDETPGGAAAAAAAPGGGLDALYDRMFVAAFQSYTPPQAAAVRALLGVLVAAQEPLSQALLEEMGLAAALPLLPGGGAASSGGAGLFSVVEHHVHPLDRSLLDFMADAGSGGGSATCRTPHADAAAGHWALAEHHVRHMSPSPLRYCMAYLPHHIAAAVAAAAASVSTAAGGTTSAAAAAAPVTLAAAQSVLDAMLSDLQYLAVACSGGLGGGLVVALASLPPAAHTQLSRESLRWLQSYLYDIEAYARLGKGGTYGVLTSLLNRCPLPSRLYGLAAAARGSGWRGERVLPWRAPHSDWQLIDLTFSNHAGPVNGVAFSPDGRQVVAVDGETNLLAHLGGGPRPDGTVRVWSTATGRSGGELYGGRHRGYVTCVAWSGDGRLIATGCEGGTICLWDPATGTCAARLKTPGKGTSLCSDNNKTGEVRSLAWQPLAALAADGGAAGGGGGGGASGGGGGGATGTRLLLAVGSGASGGALSVWDVSNLAAPRCLTVLEFPRFVLSLAWRPDGRELAGAVGGAVKVWDVDALAAGGGGGGKDVYDADDGVTGLTYSPCGNRLLLGRVRHVWDEWLMVSREGGKIVMSNKDRVDSRSRRGELNAVVWSPPRPKAAVATEALPEDHRAAAEAAMVEAAATAEAADERLSWVATTAWDGLVHVWCDHTGKLLTTLQAAVQGRVMCMRVSPDGRRLAVGTDGRAVLVWDVETAVRRAREQQRGQVAEAAAKLADEIEAAVRAEEKAEAARWAAEAARRAAEAKARAAKARKAAAKEAAARKAAREAAKAAKKAGRGGERATTPATHGCSGSASDYSDGDSDYSGGYSDYSDGDSGYSDGDSDDSDGESNSNKDTAAEDTAAKDTAAEATKTTPEAEPGDFASRVAAAIVKHGGKLTAKAARELSAPLWTPPAQAVCISWQPSPAGGATRGLLAVCYHRHQKGIMDDAPIAALELWDPDTGGHVDSIPMSVDHAPYTTALWSPDGRRLITGGYNPEGVLLWGEMDSEDRLADAVGRKLKLISPGGLWAETLPQHTLPVKQNSAARVYSLACGPGRSSGSCLAAASSDPRFCAIFLWDLAEGRAHSVLGAPQPGETPTMVFAPGIAWQPMGGAEGAAAAGVGDGGAASGGGGGGGGGGPGSGLLAACSGSEREGQGGLVWLWDHRTGGVVGTLRTPTQQELFQVDWSPDGGRLASCGMDTSIWMWDVRKPAEVLFELKGHTQPVPQIAWAPTPHGGSSGGGGGGGGGEVLVSAGEDKMVRLWDGVSGEPLCEPMREHVSELASVGFSPDGRRFATGSYDGLVRVWGRC